MTLVGAPASPCLFHIYEDDHEKDTYLYACIANITLTHTHTHTHTHTQTNARACDTHTHTDISMKIVIGSEHGGAFRGLPDI